ncbi:MAG: HEAT repeat domain-containing protein [Elusimicrobia bacterium]|nr:HEAT repeat domain-containing protein [Elusimicrobiota bacterium]
MSALVLMISLSGAWASAADRTAFVPERLLLAAAAKAAGASRLDLGVRPSRWDTRMALPAAEGLLDDPLSIPGRMAAWKERLLAAKASSDCLRAASGVLFPSPEAPAEKALPAAARGTPSSQAQDVLLSPEGAAARGTPSSQAQDVLLSPEGATPRIPPGFDPPLRRELELLVTAMSQAQALVDRAVASMPARERSLALAEVMAVVTSSTPARPDPAAYDAMSRFDLRSMVQAAAVLTRAVDLALPGLAKAARTHITPAVRWSMPFGDVLVSSAKERVYTAQDLEGVALLIHLGGGSVYSGPVAAAGAGQVRLVIDLGESVAVESRDAGPTAGSGIFGVGLLYLPSAGGPKRLAAGDWSLGSGLFGVGGLFIAGYADTVEGRQFTQGAAAFGVGVLSSRGDRSVFKADLSGQGYGFTRGAGLFVHRGDNAVMEGGLTYPDPREPAATLSMCQGAAYGHRAFSAGGFGAAVLQGDDATVTGSYFAQGSGYWHGIGLMAVRGNRNALKARRYSQGAGIHTAVGGLLVEGDANTLVNWGVGPAFGWDYGVGYWSLKGDGNSARADWGTGRGDVNGHGLAVVQGSGNRLSLPDFGTGFLKRSTPGYGLAAVRGRDNRLGLSCLGSELRGPLDLTLGSWGVVQGDAGLILDPKLSLPAPSWPTVDRAQGLEKERLALTRMLNLALNAPPAEKLAGLLHVASSFGVDAELPRAALRELSLAGDADLPHLLRLVSPDRFIEHLWLRVLLAAEGPAVADWAGQELGRSRGTSKALLAHLLRYGRAEQGLRLLRPALADPDWRVRREAVSSIGYLFDREEGDEPGRLRLLEAPVSSSTPAGEAAKLLGRKRPVDVMAALSLAGALTGERRAAMVDRFPGPTDPLPPEALAAFLEQASGRADAVREAFSKELREAARLEPEAASLLRQAANDPDIEVAAAALVSLGLLGRPQDAPAIAAFLQNVSAILREAAAHALARMGPAGRPAIEAALASKTSRLREAACKAAGQSSDGDALMLLGRCLQDRQSRVRAAGAAALGSVQGTLQARKKALRPSLRKLAESDPFPSVRAAAAYAASLIGE